MRMALQQKNALYYACPYRTVSCRRNQTNKSTSQGEIFQPPRDGGVKRNDTDCKIEHHESLAQQLVTKVQGRWSVLLKAELNRKLGKLNIYFNQYFTGQGPLCTHLQKI